EAGKNLTVGILQDECRHSNRRFFTYHENQRPYIILKWAESADGFLSPSSRLLDHSIIGSLDSPNDGLLNDSVNGFDQSKNQKIEPANHPIIEQSRNRTIYNKAPVWITNPYSRQLVHKWRSEEAAILVGTQTVLDDNPQLDVRTWTGTNPVRVVLDRTGRIDDYHYVKNQKIKTIVLTENNNLTNLDNLLYEVVAFNQNLPQAICSVLHRHGLLSVIIEGGRQTLQTFIDASLYDEARVFKGPVVFGNGTPAPQFTGLLTNKETILDDELLIFRKYD
ncbi:MAG: RibD family protein, partial [Bacteroidota bacterium]